MIERSSATADSEKTHCATRSSAGNNSPTVTGSGRMSKMIAESLDRSVAPDWVARVCRFAREALAVSSNPPLLLFQRESGEFHNCAASRAGLGCRHVPSVRGARARARAWAA